MRKHSPSGFLLFGGRWGGGEERELSTLISKPLGFKAQEEQFHITKPRHFQTPCQVCPELETDNILLVSTSTIPCKASNGTEQPSGEK